MRPAHDRTERRRPVTSLRPTVVVAALLACICLLATPLSVAAAQEPSGGIPKPVQQAINNAGPIFWWDILTPLTLLVALLILHR